MLLKRFSGHSARASTFCRNSLLRCKASPRNIHLEATLCISDFMSEKYRGPSSDPSTWEINSSTPAASICPTSVTAIWLGICVAKSEGVEYELENCVQSNVIGTWWNTVNPTRTRNLVVNFNWTSSGAFTCHLDLHRRSGYLWTFSNIYGTTDANLDNVYLIFKVDLYN